MLAYDKTILYKSDVKIVVEDPYPTVVKKRADK